MSYNHFLLFFSALKASTGSNIHRASSKWAPGRYAEYGVVADIGTRIRPQGCDIRANSEDHSIVMMHKRKYRRFTRFQGCHWLENDLFWPLVGPRARANPASPTFFERSGCSQRTIFVLLYHSICRIITFCYFSCNRSECMVEYSQSFIKMGPQTPKRYAEI